MAIAIIFIQSFLCSFSLLLTKKDFAYFKDFGSFISFPFFAKKKEKKRKQRKGKHAIKMNELSETTFPNLPFTAQRAVCTPFYKTFSSPIIFLNSSDTSSCPIMFSLTMRANSAFLNSCVPRFLKKSSR